MPAIEKTDVKGDEERAQVAGRTSQVSARRALLRRSPRSLLATVGGAAGLPGGAGGGPGAVAGGTPPGGGKLALGA